MTRLQLLDDGPQITDRLVAHWAAGDLVSLVGSYKAHFRDLFRPTLQADHGVAAGLVSITSGSTGEQKLVHVPWSAVEARCRMSVAAIGHQNYAVTLSTLSPSYSGGAVLGRLAAHYAGGQAASWTYAEGANIFPVVDDQGVTCLICTPGTHIYMLRSFPTPKQKTLRCIISVGDPMTAEAYREIRDGYGIAPINIYGSNETGIVSISDGEEPVDGCVGRVVDGVEARIAGGVLEVRSSGLASGYYGEGPLPVDGEGWYSTGDLAEIKRDKLYLMGRKSA